MTIKCFWLEETGRAKLSLRRYAWAPEPPHMQHVAVTPIDADFAMAWSADGYAVLAEEHAIADDDARWPTTCSQGDGYAFAPSDDRYTEVTAIYRRSDTGELLTFANAPVGAMWRERWYEPYADQRDDGRKLSWRRGPEGMCICVRTPGGDWSIDRKSAQGNSWERSGTPPQITASPSILFPQYHGWLRNGELVDA